MTPRNNEQPRLLSPPDLQDAADTMSAAFHEDPLWVFIYPDARRRRQALAVFFEAVLNLGIRLQRVYGIGSPATAVAAWEFPGQPRHSASPSALKPFLRLALGPFAIAAFKARNVFGGFEQIRKMHAPGPHFYLQTIGIRPECQGRGLASRMIRPFLEQADARGLGSYTETVTPANVSLYQHYGFQVVEENAAPGTPLRLWGFHRPANPSNQG